MKVFVLLGLFACTLAGNTGSEPKCTSKLHRSKLVNFKGGASETVDMVVVGCGAPKRGMGWYHATQLMNGDIPSGRLDAIVEPFFMGAGKDTPPGKAFNGFMDESKPKYDTEFIAALEDWKPKKEKTCALIAGRTADNPRIFKMLVDKGCKHIYLEKPGAPSVEQLEEMAAYAKKKGVKVYVGYNKNVTKYVRLAREFEAMTAGATTTFIHNNAYKPEELEECFSRNAEGMLKNMAVHELALLVTYYGVAADQIAEVIPDMEFSSMQTLGGFTDFDKIGFTIKTKAGKSVTVKANRCGGSCSEALVSVDGKVVFKSMTPDAELEAKVSKQQAADPEMMPYFFLQSDDYYTLKETVCAHIASGAKGSPEGIATIDIAVETLKVAEYLTPLLQKALA